MAHGHGGGTKTAKAETLRALIPHVSEDLNGLIVTVNSPINLTQDPVVGTEIAE